MLKNKCKITVITVVFNGVQSIEKTILSVINQTYFNNMEYIIIDGGSTDGTLDIIKKYEKYLSYWVTEPDKGIYDAMNKGGKKASGDFIFYLNSDDIFHNNDIVENIFGIININKYDFIYGNVNVYSNKNKFSYISKNKYTKNNLKKGRKLIHQSFFLKKKILKELDYFDLGFKIASDFDLECRIIFKKKLNVKYVDYIICNYNADGFSSNLIGSYTETSLIIKKYFPRINFIFYNIRYKIKLLIHHILNKLNLYKYLFYYK